MSMLRAAFTKYPIITNSIFYGGLYVGAEFSQQTITRKLLAKPPIDYDTNALINYGIFGGIIISPTLTIWYRWLDKRYVAKTAKVIIKKLLLDQCVLTPPLLLVFFIGMSILEQKQDIFEDCRNKMLPTYVKSCMFWFPAQTLNFLMVPPTFRVLYIGSCAFVWVNILCYIKRQQD